MFIRQRNNEAEHSSQAATLTDLLIRSSIKSLYIDLGKGILQWQMSSKSADIQRATV
jgi:hypothetical protein